MPRDGRPPYAPTDKERAATASRINSLVLADTTQRMIARIVGISPGVLRREYRKELDTAYAVILAEIGGGMITAARPDPRTGMPRDLKAAMFYLETHGWARSEHHEITGKDGAPIVVKSYVVRAPSPTESAAEWLQTYAPPDPTT
jgi:hypothetical protein